MTDITCQICTDLMPLVQDGIASDDSCQALRRHTESCPACRALFQGEPPASGSQDALWQKTLGQIKRRLQLLAVMALMCGMFLGLGLTGNSGMFYNTLLMPVIGILGYCLFRWRALYAIPLLLLLLHPIANLAAVFLEGEPLDFLSIAAFTGIYSIFALAGTLIAGLVHFAFQKGKALKPFALAWALVLALGLGWMANGLVGNPISKSLASESARGYLSQRFPGTDFYLEGIHYDFKTGSYRASIKSSGSMDRYFSIYLDMAGQYLWDTYGNVEDKSNTALRLDQEYRELTDKVFKSPSFPYHSDIMYGHLEIYPRADLLDAGENDIPGYALVQEELAEDKLYDIQKLGAQAGHLVIYVESNTITAEKAAEAILEIRRQMDDAGVPFHAMEFHLEEPLPEDGSPRNKSIDVLEILSQDIYKDGLAGRIERADAAAKAHSAQEGK